jgi:hypothetical protein
VPLLDRPAIAGVALGYFALASARPALRLLVGRVVGGTRGP